MKFINNIKRKNEIRKLTKACHEADRFENAIARKAMLEDRKAELSLEHEGYWNYEIKLCNKAIANEGKLILGCPKEKLLGRIVAIAFALAVFASVTLAIAGIFGAGPFASFWAAKFAADAAKYEAFIAAEAASLGLL